jgi:hypothetical protein
VNRREFGLGAAALAATFAAPVWAQSGGMTREKVLHNWYRLVLELVRHTATYTPPVASRAFAYLGVVAHEVTAGDVPLAGASLYGQLPGYEFPPVTAMAIDQTIVLHGAMAHAVNHFFGNTGPTGQRAIKAMDQQIMQALLEGTPMNPEGSRGWGTAVAQHVIDWSANDGGAVVENMGFPREFALAEGPGKWVPTNAVRQQQLPLLPGWGNNRTFAAPSNVACVLAAPVEYSEDPASAFYAEANEVYETTNALTDDQKAIARFWSDDPMLSPTPPGHWISIAMQLLEEEQAPVQKRAAVMAGLGIAVADAFICCWHDKFEVNLLRPITYIRAHIDKKWTPLLNTPPFPEYPSGHSVQSGAAQVVMDRFFGANRAFTDETGTADGLKPRSFNSFKHAADEAGISRLYGGIHFRAAIDRGLEQGRCIGGFAANLKFEV